MEWKNSEFGEVGNQLVLPLFKGVGKAPNNSLSGLNRTQRTLVREAIASDDFEGKKGQRMAVWSPGCRVLLVGMGEKGERAGHNAADDFRDHEGKGQRGGEGDPLARICRLCHRMVMLVFMTAEAMTVGMGVCHAP